MNIQTKRRISKIITPVAIGLLKLHTFITGAQRARMIILNQDNQVLLVRGLIGESWTFPGGGINRGETSLDGAIREVYEEIGVRINAETITHVVTFTRPHSPVAYTAHIFQTVVTNIHLPQKLHNPLEIMEIAWFSLDSLPVDVSPIVPSALQHLSKH